MPNFSLTISGLCVFAFDQPVKGNGKDPTQVRLLLQRLNRSQELDNMNGTSHEVLDQHFPMLELNPGDLATTSTRVPDFAYAPDATGTMGKAACTLFGDDLTILIDGSPMKPNALKMTRTPPTNPSAVPLSAGADQETLWWMATLDDAFPGNGKINPIFINSAPGPNQSILARVLLSEGTLKTLDLTDQPCTFVSPGSQTFRQRIATSFVLQVPFHQTVEIRMARPNSSAKIDTRSLVFTPAAGKDLQIAIKNVEIDSALGIPLIYAPRSVADFEIYAQLLLNPPKGVKPFLKQSSPGSPSGVGLSSCPPTGGG